MQKVHVPLYSVHAYYRSNPKNLNEAILSWGDTGGCVTILHFSNTTIALFDRQANSTTENQGLQSDGRAE